MKNCKTCSRATVIGDILRCGFTPPKAILASFPYYPVFSVSIRRMQISLDKIPNANCPAWSEPKTVKIGEGEEFKTVDQALAAGATSIQMPGKGKVIPVNSKDFTKTKSKPKAKGKK